MGFVVAPISCFEYSVFDSHQAQSRLLLAAVDSAVRQQRGLLPTEGRALEMLSPKHAASLREAAARASGAATASSTALQEPELKANPDGRRAAAAV